MPTRLLSRLPWTLLTSLYLTACATVGSNGTRLECPPLASYTTADEAEVWREEQAAGAMVWTRFILDYGRLRAECRAIPGAK